MIGDDLTGLFRPAPGPEPFRQGTVTAFDPVDGSNTIAVAGGVLTDVPMLNIGDVIDLAAGDVVVLLRMRSSWAILGRIVPVGSSDLASQAVKATVMGAGATNFAVSTTPTVKASASLSTPSWANKAATIVTASASVWNTSGATRWFGVTANTTSATSGMLGATVANTAWNNAAATTIRLLTNPPATITCDVTLQSDAAIPAHASTACSVSALTVFYRE